MQASVRPRSLSLEELRAALAAPGARGFVWCSDRLRASVDAASLGPRISDLDALPEDATHLVAVGGGKRLDRAKAWRVDARPGLWLAAIPTLYGSGAEASPVVVLDGREGKEIRLGEEFLPDARALLPGVLATVPEAALRAGSGDVLSHAFEAFLSPLADAELQREAAALLGELQEPPGLAEPRWFDLAARACTLQARASVGLVHGIAHQLEPRLAGERGASGLPFGHAALCALFLWPVLAFDRAHSSKASERAAAVGLDLDGVEARARELFTPADYVAVLPHLEAAWRAILRDPCTRTNGVLVRPAHITWFIEEAIR